MSRSVKAVLAFIIIIGVVFAAVYLYRYGIPRFGRTEIASSSSAISSTTVATATSSSIPSNSSNSNTSGMVSTAVSYLSKIGDILKTVIEWIISSIKSSDIGATVVKGIVMTSVFIILGYLVNVVAKFIKFILYGFGVITAIITMLIVLGIL